MALTDDGGMVLPVTTMNNGGGFGNFGGDSWGWIILLLLFASGGWGNGFGGGADMYPWLNQSNQVNDGFIIVWSVFIATRKHVFYGRY